MLDEVIKMDDGSTQLIPCGTSEAKGGSQIRADGIRNLAGKQCRRVVSDDLLLVS